MMRRRFLRLLGVLPLLLVLMGGGVVLLGQGHSPKLPHSPALATPGRLLSGEKEGAFFPTNMLSSARPLPRVGPEQEVGPRLSRAAPQDYIWHIETVESAGHVGAYTSLALDAAGRPHLSYCQMMPSMGYCAALRYARYDGAAWITTTVETGWDVGHGTSLALDTAGRPHIAYSGEGVVRYAYYDGTAWIKQTVGSGCCPSLALDVTGRPHIALYSAGLRYAYHDGTTWRIETVESGTCASASLVLDAAGQPHISYLSGAPAIYLKYAYHDGAAWQVETVTFTGSGAYPPTSLALDSCGLPHIAYSMGEPMVGGWQMYARYDGQSWHTKVIEDHSGSGALVLDTADRPHVVYNGAGLRYAYLDDTIWISETMAPTDPAVDISLALDTVGWIHASYYSGDLEYAYQCTPVNRLTVVGPFRLPLGITERYSATYQPLTATLPMNYTWNNGTRGPTALYSWTLTGTFPVAVTATNSCNQVADVLPVTVFCQPPAEVRVDGPGALLIGQEGIYQAAVEPLTASLPITFTWDNGSFGLATCYSWTVTGTYTLTVTATSVCGDMRTTTRSVHILAAWPYHRYLPLYWATVKRE